MSSIRGCLPLRDGDCEDCDRGNNILQDLDDGLPVDQEADKAHDEEASAWGGRLANTTRSVRRPYN